MRVTGLIGYKLLFLNRQSNVRKILNNQIFKISSKYKKNVRKQLIKNVSFRTVNVQFLTAFNEIILPLLLPTIPVLSTQTFVH